jgi:hypothetical protein
MDYKRQCSTSLDGLPWNAKQLGQRCSFALRNHADAGAVKHARRFTTFDCDVADLTARFTLNATHSHSCVRRSMQSLCCTATPPENVSLQKVKRCVESGKTHYGLTPVRLASRGGRCDTTSAHPSVPAAATRACYWSKSQNGVCL